VGKTFKLIAQLAVLVVAAVWFVGCRGQISKEPPIHLNPNMDNQAKYKAYGESDFFEDGRAMRPVPEGTVARGQLNQGPYYTGKSKGSYIDNPLNITDAVMFRGQERYNIYCSMCHGQTGLGGGIVVKKGYVPPPSYADKRIMKMKDGEFFQIITHGVRTMPAYSLQIPVKDRWAIVAYIRALQKAQSAALEDIDTKDRSRILPMEETVGSADDEDDEDESWD
jgi:cytochrome c5